MHHNEPLKSPSLTQSKALATLGCLGLALVLTACSSVKTHVNKGPVRARTFSFLETGANPLPEYAEARKEAHVAVQQAVTRNLAAKGVSYVAKGGDVTVAYLIVVGNNGTTTAIDRYFGYTSDSDAFLQKVHSEQTEGKDRGYFEAGTLVIDLIDPPSSKLLQRRSVQAQVLRNLSQEQRNARVQGIVDQALKDVVFFQ